MLATGGATGLALRGSQPLEFLPPGLRSFSAAEASLVAALAEVMLPSRVGFPSWQDADVLMTADRLLQRTEPEVTAEVKQLLGLFENALPVFLFSGHTAPFTQLARDAQERVLEGWRDSRLVLRRTGYQALRGLLLAAYYASPLTWRAVGYPGPPSLEAAR